MDTRLWANGDVWLPKASLSENDLQNGNWIEVDGDVTTPEYDRMETEIAENLIRLLCNHDVEVIANVNELVQEAEQEMGLSLAKGQRAAVIQALRNNVCIITGGPGTGKTTTLNVLEYCLKKQYTVKYVSPTGKAACRITESTGSAAATCHKEFSIGMNGAYFFLADVLIIDEASFMDMEIIWTILKNMGNNTRVYVVGDPEQLLSVGCGQVLNDLIRSGEIPCAMLTETFRQDTKKALFKNIENIRKGIFDPIPAEDFEYLELQENISAEQVRDLTIKKYMEARGEFGENPEDVCLLLPYRRKGFCSNVLANILQRVLNKQKTGYKYVNRDGNTIWFMKGDYVMQLQNRGAVVNGSIGKVICVDATGVTVEYPKATLHYPPCDMEQLSLAYATTIHKSQGSEYKAVVIVLLKQHSVMLLRNLLYVAVTRAKKKCILICEREAYKKALDTVPFRRTHLVEKIKDARDEYKLIYGV